MSVNHGWRDIHPRPRPEILAHLQNTTSTPAPSSTVTAWISQLPSPHDPSSRKRKRSHPPSGPLAPVSSNPQRFAEATVHRQSSPACQPKRRAPSPHETGREKRRAQAKPAQQATGTSLQSSCLRRSARLAATHKMSNRNTARGKVNTSPPLTNQLGLAAESDEVDMEEEADGYGMVTRRGRAIHRLSQTLTNHLPAVDDGPIPHFTPQTPSRGSYDPFKSASPSKTGRKQSQSASPSKAGRKKSASPKKSQNSETGSAYSVGIKSRNQLGQMAPAIVFHPVSSLKDPEVPKPVVQFWSQYMASAVSATEVIPRERAGPLETKYNTPMKTRPQISANAYADNLYDPADLDKVVETVKEVLVQAEKYRGQVHEPQWVSKVVGPLLGRLVKLAPFLAGDEQMIEDLNVSTVSIAPHQLCPTSPTEVFADADKKIDYALALELSNAERLILSAGRYQLGGPASINQTQTDFTCMKPIFSHFEVKTDVRDPMIQLAVWITAEFLKRWQEGWRMDLPVPAIAIYEDHWALWIAYAVKVKQGGNNKAFMVQFAGPWEIGHTMHVAGVFRILHVLQAIAKWGLEVYLSAFRKDVLAKIKKSNS
ncbi:MAG: hypothetical protein Q9216_004809 [Gyalolechia sp. 2 TL-2023]